MLFLTKLLKIDIFVQNYKMLNSYKLSFQIKWCKLILNNKNLLRIPYLTLNCIRGYHGAQHFVFQLSHFNPSSPKGGCTTPLTVIALVLKIAQPRGKIAPGTFKFILSLHFSEKISNLPPTPGVG